MQQVIACTDSHVTTCFGGNLIEFCDLSKLVCNTITKYWNKQKNLLWVKLRARGPWHLSSLDQWVLCHSAESWPKRAGWRIYFVFSSKKCRILHIFLWKQSKDV